MNPYVWNEVQPKLCYGRDALLNELFDGLAGSPRYSFGLAGGRRMGKSTTLRRVELDLRARLETWLAGGRRVIPIYVDGLALPRPLTAADVWGYLLTELQRALPESPLQANKPPDFATFKDIVQPVLAGLPERPRLIVMIDEIEPIAVCDWAQGFLAHWRALLSNTPGLSEYFTAVFSGGRQLAILQRDIGSPLKDILEWRSLRCLEFEPACDLMQEPIQRVWPASFLEQVYKESGGHPFLLQYIMHQLCKLSDEEAEQAIARTIDKFNRDREWQLAEWWNRYCTKTARQLYQRLPDDGSTISRRALTAEFGTEAASNALEILQHVGLVAAEDDGFAFRYTGEIFRHWYRDYVAFARSPGQKPKTQPTVFISYSHEDEPEKDQLLTHLDVLQKAGLIDLWSDDRISGGGDWEQEITEAMNKATVAILLISANFLTSDFILGVEVPTLLKRRKEEGLYIFPVIARACYWEAFGWLGEMNVRPRDNKPVWGSGRPVDKELKAITREIAGIVNR